MGTATVAKILADVGHAVETVVNDYGEDLLVQTSHAGQMDASRLWIQVKSTDDIAGYRIRSGDLSLSVPFDHAVRWSRSLDLVVVVLCDVNLNEAWYTVPSGQLDEWAGRNNQRRYVTLRFGEHDVLTTRVAKRLAWESRLAHHRHLLLSTRQEEKEAKEEGLETTPLSGMLLTDLLLSLGLCEIGSDGETYVVTDPTRESWEKNFDVASADVEEEEVNEAAYLAAAQAVLERANTIDPELGLRLVIVDEMANALLVALGLKELLDSFEAADKRKAAIVAVNAEG